MATIDLIRRSCNDQLSDLFGADGDIYHKGDFDILSYQLSIHNLKCTFCVAVYKQDKIAIAFKVSDIKIKKDNIEALLAINEHNLTSSEYRVAYDFNSSDLIAFGLSGREAKDIRINTIKNMSDETMDLVARLLRLIESHSEK